VGVELTLMSVALVFVLGSVAMVEVEILDLGVEERGSG
jgi:hypothetical protein